MNIPDKSTPKQELLEFNNQNEKMTLAKDLLNLGYIETFKDFFNLFMKENNLRITI